MDLVKKSVLREVNIPEQPQYWRWVNDNIVGVVGAKFIYHIDINTTPPTAPATKVFEK